MRPGRASLTLLLQLQQPPTKASLLLRLRRWTAQTCLKQRWPQQPAAAAPVSPDHLLQHCLLPVHALQLAPGALLVLLQQQAQSHCWSDHRLGCHCCRVLNRRRTPNRHLTLNRQTLQTQAGSRCDRQQ
jgi:hypothetical protein